MISLRRGTKPKLVLAPRQGFKRTHTEVELPLLFGYVCPTCANVIYAEAMVPLTSKVVSKDGLFPYEETTVLSQGEKNAGEVLKTVPNEREQDSCYDVHHFSGADPAKDGILQIRLKNHVVKPASYYTKVKSADPHWFHETGERTCFKTAFIAEREDLLMRDFLHMSGFSTDELRMNYNLPKVLDLMDHTGKITHGATQSDFRLVNAVGNAPVAILLDRSYLQNMNNYWLRYGMTPFLKSK